MNNQTLYAAILAMVAVVAAGCSQETIDSAANDAQKNAKIVAREAHRAEQKLRPDLKKLGLGARVTAAIQANQNLPHTIRVDAGTGGVFLRGTVKTEEQKALAGRIARDTLSSEYTVQNDLKVTGS